MNLAMRLLMGSRFAAGASDRLVRVKTTYAGTGTSHTVSFDEGTALDSSHLLVAIIHWNNATAVAVSGWTEAAGGGANSSTQLRIFARQGDGSANSVTVTGSNTNKTVTLLAFSGFVSATPLNSNGSSAVSAESTTVTPSATPAGFGVALAAVALATAPTAWGGWSGGFAENDGTVDANFRQRSARAEYDGSGSYATTFTWTGSRAVRRMSTIYELTP